MFHWRHHFILLPVLLLLCASCPTRTVNWTARVGKLTYEESVVELGPPDKKEKLSDGTIVAEWLTRHGYAYSVPQSSPYWWNGPFYPEIETAPNWYLRLIFAPEGKLKEWKRFAK